MFLPIQEALVVSEDALWNLFVVRIHHVDKFLLLKSLGSIGGRRQYLLSHLRNAFREPRHCGLHRSPVDSIEDIKTNLLGKAKSLYVGSAGIIMGLLRRLTSASLGQGACGKNPPNTTELFRVSRHGQDCGHQAGVSKRITRQRRFIFVYQRNSIVMVYRPKQGCRPRCGGRLVDLRGHSD
jgi:hypothetical protein